MEALTATPTTEALNQVLEQSWSFWQQHKAEFERTKAWRVIESLIGLAAVRAAAPVCDMASLILGTACVTSQRVEALRFSFTTSSQVQATIDLVPCALDLASDEKLSLGLAATRATFNLSPAPPPTLLCPHCCL